MRPDFLPFHRPFIGEEEIAGVVEVMRSGWLTTGPKARQFEQEFAAYVGSRHSVATNSGTAALHLALRALDLDPGSEVIVPTYTFVATSEIVLHVGARPVLVDSRTDTFNMDERAIEKSITPKTRAIIPVHIAGHPCDMAEIIRVAEKHNLRVIEDAAHALPANYRSKRVGSIGDITAFSFYATKPLTTAEGGMVVTANADYADQMRALSLHGISEDPWNRYDKTGSWYYEVHDTGYKYNLSDVSAAIGLGQLRRCDETFQRRQQIAKRYSDALAEVDELRTPRESGDVEHAWHLYIILLNLEALTIDRAQFIEELQRRNIGTSVHFIPLHLHPYYRKTFGFEPGDFPNAEWTYERCISLPIYPGMTDADVQDVVDAVTDIAARNRH